MNDHKNYLAETEYINYSHPDIQSLINQLKGTSTKDKVLELYYKIRDDIHYDPYTFAHGIKSLKASYAASNSRAYCIPKSALMVACCRAIGVPAKLGLADVKNHLSSPKLLAWLQTDLFVMHAYCELFLNNKWVKCTPVFNKVLCDKFGITPLEFDTENNSIFHQFTESGHQHMEYVTDHGTFADLPIAFMLSSVKTAYPHLNFKQYLTEGFQDDAFILD